MDMPTVAVCKLLDLLVTLRIMSADHMYIDADDISDFIDRVRSGK
jgi:hypothetical protein